MEITLRDVVALLIAKQLRAVVAFHGVGQHVQELDELGRRLVGQIERQTQQGQIVRPQHMHQRALCGAEVRALALRATRSFASLNR